MKYTLINCYSDNNKGDLGIILSTIYFLNKNDRNAKISGISTYNYSDPYYHSEHKLLSQNIKMYPSIFGELNIGKLKSGFPKLVRLFFDSIRILLFIILPKFIGKPILFSLQEKSSIQEIINSDFVISKGGSFICNETNIRTRIALIRFLFIFFLCIKLNKKIVILCQSLGPVYGSISRRIVNYILSKCHAVVLREDVCISEYKYLKLNSNSTYLLNDIAFYLPEKSIDLSFDPKVLNIGVTVKHVSPSLDSKYQDMMVESIIYCLDKLGAQVFIFPHVTVDNDLDAAFCIYNRIPDRLKSNLSIFTDNYQSGELKSLYGKMNMLIGTRLHSTIFASGVYTPSICISYHGTKSKGIFRNINSEDFLVENYCSIELISKIDLLSKNIEKQQSVLKSELLTGEAKFNDVFNKIFHG